MIADHISEEPSRSTSLGSLPILSVSGVQRKMTKVLSVRLHHQPSVSLSGTEYESDPFLLSGRVGLEPGPGGGETVLILGRKMRGDFLDPRIQSEGDNRISKYRKRCFPCWWVPQPVVGNGDREQFHGDSCPSPNYNTSYYKRPTKHMCVKQI